MGPVFTAIDSDPSVVVHTNGGALLVAATCGASPIRHGGHDRLPGGRRRRPDSTGHVTAADPGRGPLYQSSFSSRPSPSRHSSSRCSGKWDSLPRIWTVMPTSSSSRLISFRFLLFRVRGDLIVHADGDACDIGLLSGEHEHANDFDRHAFIRLHGSAPVAAGAVGVDAAFQAGANPLPRHFDQPEGAGAEDFGTSAIAFRAHRARPVRARGDVSLCACQ